VQQFQQLWCDFHGKQAHTRHIAARTVHACDESELYGITDGGEDDRDSARSPLGCNRGRRGGRGDDVHLALDQIGDK
jgi:hypothetical protein